MQTTVLNVDDNPANRYVRTRALRSAGFDVLEAATGEGALALAREQRPFLLLLDIKLPDMSGLEVCRQLRSESWARHIGIIHISATYLNMEEECFRAGADIYLAEPVEAQELLSAVQTLMRLRRTEDRLAASEERMRLAMDAANIATWDIDVATGEGIWCDNFHRLMGCAPGSLPPSLAAWLERITPADREAFRAAVGRAVETGEPLRHEHSIIRADNSAQRCLSVHGMVRRSEPGGAGRLIGVALDVTERKKAESERETLLRQAQAGRQAAEEAGRIKDEFLATLSHELRTPLTAMLGWIQLIRMGRLSGEQQVTAFETIERNALLQIRLVNDLLDVSQIVAGRLKLELDPVGLDQVLLSTVESHRPAAADKSLELQLSVPPGPFIVRGSEERLEQVFNNLLSNAVKFTREGGKIAVSLSRAGQNARVNVTDDGEGIPAEAVPHLFDRFWQFDSSDRRRHGGLGLGLAIVRSIVEMHGGTVAASSAGPGLGSTFTVILPLSAAESAPGRGGAQSAQSRSLAGLRILIVDDNADTLDMVAMILQAEGAAVKCGLSADAAFEIASDWKADVLILDVAMPGEDGYALLKRLRKLRGSESVPPALAVTGYAGAEARQRALDNGFQAHLAKPFSVDELVTVIATLTGGKAGPQ